MKKKLIILFITICLSALTTSCTLEDIMGNNVKGAVAGLTIPVTAESEFASSMQGIQVTNEVSSDIYYIIGPLGSLGMGSFSISSIASQAVRDNIIALGEHDPSGGHYTRVIDNLSTKGVSKIFFLKNASNAIDNNNIIYLDIKWAIDYDNVEQPVYVYKSADITSDKYDIKKTTFTGRWLPGPWRSFKDGQPVNTGDWLSVNRSDFANYNVSSNNSINTFLREKIQNYGGLAVITNVQQSDRTLYMFYSVDKGAEFVPTNSNPAHQKGYGTITFSTGTYHQTALVLDIKNFDLTIGENYPIGGTIETSRSDGFSTFTTYNSDGSSTVLVYKNGKVIAYINLNANGTGTYTDTSGKAYPIN